MTTNLWPLLPYSESIYIQVQAHKTNKKKIKQFFRWMNASLYVFLAAPAGQLGEQIFLFAFFLKPGSSSNFSHRQWAECLA